MSRRANVVRHGGNHSPGGSDPLGPVDSTENVGTDWGVRSVGANLGDVLRSDGAEGSLWLPMVGAGTYRDLVLGDPNLVGLWPMDDASGAAQDATANNRDLTAVGTPTYSAAGPFTGSSQTAINLQGTDALGTWNDDSFSWAGNDFNFAGSPMTCELLLYPTAYPGVGGGILQGQGGLGGFDDSWHLSLRPDGQVFYTTGATGQVESGSSHLLPLNAWSHICATYDGTTNADALKLYIDGVLVATATGVVIPSHGTGFRVGVLINATDNVRYMRGRYSNIALYNAALSPSAILAHAYAAGFSGTGNDLTPDQLDAIRGANAPSSGNPFATISDVGTGSPTGAAGGALDGTYPNPGIASSVAGAGLAETSNVLSVNVDGSTIEINSDTLRVKDLGVTAAKMSSGAATNGQVATANGSGAVTFASPAGASPTNAYVWMPLTSTVGGDDVLVFDANHQLIPTITPM